MPLVLRTIRDSHRTGTASRQEVRKVIRAVESTQGGIKRGRNGKMRKGRPVEIQHP